MGTSVSVYYYNYHHYCSSSTKYCPDATSVPSKTVLGYLYNAKVAGTTGSAILPTSGSVWSSTSWETSSHAAYNLVFSNGGWCVGGKEDTAYALCVAN